MSDFFLWLFCISTPLLIVGLTFVAFKYDILGLVLIGLAGVSLYLFILIESNKEAKDQQKRIDEINKILKGKQ
jgi:hypothetical protein